MKAKTLTFEEHYLDEKPKTNYWRGINAYAGEVQIFSIPLQVNDNEWHLGGKDYFFIENKFFPSLFYDRKLEQIQMKSYFNYDDDNYGRKLFTDKEKVKECAQKAFEEFLGLLTE